MPLTVVLGSQWGDEGKGKLVDILSQTSELCCRFAGGNNAGHTIIVNNITFDFHLLPSGFVNENCINVIGSGVVVHLPSLFSELSNLSSKGLKNVEQRLKVSDRAHLVFDFHMIVDGLKEQELGMTSIGTTKRGIGPAYSAKSSRSGLRVHMLMEALADVENNIKSWEDTDFIKKLKIIVQNRRKRYGHFDYDLDSEVKKYFEYAKLLKPIVEDTVSTINSALKNDSNVLVEGANALMLDIDYGTYPYVTSSNCSVGGVCTGLGIPPRFINNVIGVVKAYTTRVGGGPFPTEQLNEIGEKLQTIGSEFGVTTGRKRRCGWLDAVVLRYSNAINGYTSINLTKLDVLDDFDEIKIGVAYIVKHRNGATERLESFPASLELLQNVQVEYEVCPGWKCSIKNCKTWDDLPLNAKKYIEKIERLLDVKVQWIGVGPKREAMIIR